MCMMERREKGLLSDDCLFMLANLKGGFFNHCETVFVFTLEKKRLLNVNEWGFRVNPSRESEGVCCVCVCVCV